MVEVISNNPTPATSSIPEIQELSDRDLDVSIKSKNKVFYEGKAYSVSSLNDTGFFDILPQHANFITLVRSSIILDKDLPTRKEIKIDRGVLMVSMNNVSGFIGI